MMESCIKNPKSFLFLKWFGKHKYEIIKVGVFMVGVSDKFTVAYKCKHCGDAYLNSFVTRNELLHAGFNNYQIDYFEKHEYPPYLTPAAGKNK